MPDSFDPVQVRARAAALHEACFNADMPTSALAILAAASAADVPAILDALDRAEARAAERAATNRDLRRRIDGALTLIDRARPRDAARGAVLLHDLRLTLESSRDTGVAA